MFRNLMNRFRMLIGLPLVPVAVEANTRAVHFWWPADFHNLDRRSDGTIYDCASGQRADRHAYPQFDR